MIVIVIYIKVAVGLRFPHHQKSKHTPMIGRPPTSGTDSEPFDYMTFKKKKRVSSQLNV